MRAPPVRHAQEPVDPHPLEHIISAWIRYRSVIVPDARTHIRSSTAEIKTPTALIKGHTELLNPVKLVRDGTAVYF